MNRTLTFNVEGNIHTVEVKRLSPGMNKKAMEAATRKGRAITTGQTNTENLVDYGYEVVDLAVVSWRDADGKDVKRHAREDIFGDRGDILPKIMDAARELQKEYEEAFPGDVKK